MAKHTHNYSKGKWGSKIMKYKKDGHKKRLNNINTVIISYVSNSKTNISDVHFNCIVVHGKGKQAEVRAKIILKALNKAQRKIDKEQNNAIL